MPDRTPTSRTGSKRASAAALIVLGGIFLGADDVAADEIADRARRGAFDATGTIRCVQRRGLEMEDCVAGIVRGPRGAARVVATFGNGFARTLIFEDGAFTGANSTMSGTGTDTDWRLEDGIHVIRVEDQRYDIPDALIFGG